MYLYMNGWILHVFFFNVGKYTVGPMDDMSNPNPCLFATRKVRFSLTLWGHLFARGFSPQPWQFRRPSKTWGCGMIFVGWCTSRNLVHYVCFRFGRTLYDLFDLVDLHCGKLIPWFTRVLAPSTIPGGCLGCLNHQLYVGSTWRIIPFISHLSHSEGE